MTIVTFGNFKIFPQIRSCAEVFGTFRRSSLKGIPISGCMTSQKAKLLAGGRLDFGDLMISVDEDHDNVLTMNVGGSCGKTCDIL